MKPMPIADAHTDYLTSQLTGLTSIDADISQQFHVSRPSLLEGNVRMQFFAAFVDSKKVENPVAYTLEQIDEFYRMLNAWGDDIVEITQDNMDQVIQNGPIGAVLTIEGGDAIGGSLHVLRIMRRLGVKAMTLTWNRDNAIGTPAIIDGETGLKPFGIECVKEMNRLHMAIDVSHLNVAGFWDVVEHSTQPIMATHSNARKECDHFRNLYDDQIKAIVDMDGFIGLNFASDFLRDKQSNLDDLLRHADYILERGGENILGLGSDWDGIERCPEELRGAQDFQKIVQRFEKAGYPQKVIEKIAYGNLVRYIRPFL
ncbi:dipeptidase [Eubacteriales bacterium OttesenSCG-928-M02]|nr:dipeptidase [Eubacteriales bacterium OttesenSCG-928-M02]